MRFQFISREQYRQKESEEFLETLDQKYNSPYIIPEGGTNKLAIKGCEEILTQAHSEFDVVCVAVGTGGTLAGLANSCLINQKVMGFSSLKGDFLNKDIKKWVKNKQWTLTDSYSFGGYGKINLDLITFINTFYKQTGVALDPLYTGKMMYGIIDLLKTNYFPEKTRILAVHTGGLQGIEGMNQKLAQNGWPLLIS
jgi:1-aminocyclopropane-1-carboxylate deaminase